MFQLGVHPVVKGQHCAQDFEARLRRGPQGLLALDGYLRNVTVVSRCAPSKLFHRCFPAVLRKERQPRLAHASQHSVVRSHQPVVVGEQDDVDPRAALRLYFPIL